MGNSEDSPVLRRSLRILAREKHKEDQQQQHQTGLVVEQSAVCDKLGNNSTETLTREDTLKRNQKASCQGTNHKCKRTPSPKRKQSPLPVPLSKKHKRSSSLSDSSPPSKKVTKKSPGSRGKEACNTIADSARHLAAGEDLTDKEGGKKKQSKKKQEVTHIGCEGRDSVIVYVPKKDKGRKGQSAKHTRTEYSESETELESAGRKGKSKRRRRSKGQGRTQSEEDQPATHKGKGRNTWGPVNPPFSLVDFPRLNNMASPE